MLHGEVNYGLCRCILLYLKLCKTYLSSHSYNSLFDTNNKTVTQINRQNENFTNILPILPYLSPKLGADWDDERSSSCL